MTNVQPSLKEGWNLRQISWRRQGCSCDAIEAQHAWWEFVDYLKKVVVADDGVFGWMPLGLRAQEPAVFHLPDHSRHRAEADMHVSLLVVWLDGFDIYVGLEIDLNDLGWRVNRISASAVGRGSYQCCPRYQ